MPIIFPAVRMRQVEKLANYYDRWLSSHFQNRIFPKWSDILRMQDSWNKIQQAELIACDSMMEPAGICVK